MKARRTVINDAGSRYSSAVKCKKTKLKHQKRSCVRSPEWANLKKLQRKKLRIKYHKNVI
jgi:hypothetical protein